MSETRFSSPTAGLHTAAPPWFGAAPPNSTSRIMAKAAARNRKPVLKKKPASRAAKTPARAPAVTAKRKQPSPASAARKPVPAKPSREQWVYTFGDGKAEGKASMRDLLGGKGANLAEMANLGLPVPPGFTITTGVCTYFYGHGKTYPAELKAQVEAALAHVGKLTGRTFGDPRDPLLVSVRSGARASMPGMMDTVLNLGLNDATVEALAKKSGDARFAYDSYRRFITMYSDVVLGIDAHHFEEILDEHKDSQGYMLDTDLVADDWKQLVGRYKARVQGGTRTGLSAGPARAVVGRDRRRVRFMDEPARHHLSPPASAFRKAGARRSTCRRWCSATWATRRRPASRSPAIHRPARSGSTASF